MVGGNPYESGMPGRDRAGGWAGLPDHQARCRGPGAGPDLRPQLLVHTVGGEALQQPSIRREHADRRVVCADELGRGLHHLPEHALERDFPDQRGGRNNQALEPLLRGDAGVASISAHGQSDRAERPRNPRAVQAVAAADSAIAIAD